MANFKENPAGRYGKRRIRRRPCLCGSNLTPELEAEGYSSEVIRRLQDMRKELDLVVDENIRAAVRIEDPRVLELVETLKGLIAEEVRARYP